ncbi:MAG: LysR family transcriptional regulator [Oscillospiraceae bacterium]|nr:LysR family transcriptional regulator [Oscillospiraceae bacterium]
MNFLTLRYFQAVAQERSFKGAAGRLGLSQQTLSEHIRRLEEELGTDLFSRTRPLTLTEAGERLMLGAEEILSAKSRLDWDLEQIKTGRHQRLSIGISKIGAPPFLSGLVRAFVTENPDCQVQIVEREQGMAPEDMRRIDLHFLTYSGARDMETIVLCHDDMALAVRESVLSAALGPVWPSLAEKMDATGDLRLMSGIPFVFLDDPSIPQGLGRERTFAAAGFAPEVVASSANDRMNYDLCCSGVGGMIAPRGILRYMQKDGATPADMRVFSIRTEGFTPELCISYERGRRLTPAAERFITCARAYFAKNTL